MLTLGGSAVNKIGDAASVAEKMAQRQVGGRDGLDRFVMRRDFKAIDFFRE
jgi:hypothetical protein